jgi:alkylhydroperoxidase family enzyme
MKDPTAGRLAPPPGAMTPFDHVPAAWAAFNRFYGTLWSAGRVDQPTKEVARLRNARRTGCGICKNLRFAGAKAAGLDEARVDLIADGFETSALPTRWKLAIRWTDALLALPAARIDPGLRRELLAEFTSAEIVELTVTITTAIAFSKAAVTFGAPPEMPVLEVPTPSPDGAVA